MESMKHDANEGTGWIRLLGAAAAGPAAVLVHELDLVPLGPAAGLWPLMVIVLAAGFGLFLGLRIGRRDLRWLRCLAAIPNAATLCFYGFLLLFFGLGGSR